MGKFLVQAYLRAFDADKFHALFDETSLDSGQDPNLALAEWHAFGAFVFTYCLWVVYDSRHRVSSILDSFRPALLGSLRLNEVSERHFLEIVSDREKDYFAHFRRARDGNDLASFFSRAAARIMGQFSSEVDLQGISQSVDTAVALAVTEYTMAVLSHTKSAVAKFGPK